MIQTDQRNDLSQRLQWLAAHGERWCHGSPAAAAVRLLYGVSSVEAGTGWMMDSRSRSDLLSLPVLSVCCVLQGAIDVEIAGAVTRCEPGDLACLPVRGANALHQADGAANVHAYIVVHHDHLTRRLAAVLHAGCVVPAAKVDLPSADAFEGVFTHGLAGRYVDAVAEEVDAFTVVCTLERLLFQAAGRGSSRAADGRGRNWQQAVERHVLQALPSRPPVAELAALCGASEGHFIRSFRAITGCTPAAFVTRMQLDEATRMLRETQAPLKVIADRVGFSSEQALAHAFRRHRSRTAGTLRSIPGRPA